MHRHFIIHKPYGYLSQFIYELKRKKKLLGELYDFPEATMAIGRLDEDSEGLLLLTTDGMMSELVRSKKVEKQYYAQVDGIIDVAAAEKLCSGVEIGVKGEKYMSKPCKAVILESDPGFSPRSQKIRDDRHGPTSWISITLTEGKFRQVRKMTSAVGFPTLRLVRVRIGNLNLGDLKSGEVIEVSDFLPALTEISKTKNIELPC
jgi:23S rRNA pseudouridine2457 synthase